MAPQLSRQQGKFLAALYNNLREDRRDFDPQFLKGWLIAENPAGAASTPQHGNQNWLNIGNTDSKFYGQGGAYSNPGQAGKNTARWLRGEWSMPGFGRAAPGIVSFARTAGQGRQAQIDALQNSGWASSGYPNLEGIVAGAGKPGYLRYTGGGQQAQPQLGRTQQSPQSIKLPDTLRLVERRAFDSAGFERATRAFQLGQILQSQPQSPFDVGARPRGTIAPSNPLLTVLPKAPPAPEAFIEATSTLERVAGRRLPVNGLVATTDAKDNPSGGPAKALSWAADRLGTSETVTNQGPKIDDWQRSFGMLAEPWCGIFVGKALQAAGVRGVDSRVAATRSIYDMAIAGDGGFQKGLVPVSKVRAGDVVVWDPGSTGHTGIVERVKEDGTIVTIEGNASNSVRRNIHAKEGAFYARPNYPAGAAPARQRNVPRVKARDYATT